MVGISCSFTALQVGFNMMIQVGTVMKKLIRWFPKAFEFFYDLFLQYALSFGHGQK